MSSNVNPDNCDNTGSNFDFSTVPKLGANLEGLGDDITAYLCNVLKLSRREDLDPLLRAGTEYNNDTWIKSLTGLHNVGDPRFSMGQMMTAALEKYLKPLEIQLKILQEGCQVTNGVLCDAEGKEIPFYGKCEVPDRDMFTYDYMTSFAEDLWYEAIDAHADNFVDYLNQNYLSKNWKIELFALGDDNFDQFKIGAAAPIFYVKLTKGTETPVYYKYYFDKRNYVANALEESITILSVGEFQKMVIDPANFDLSDTITGPHWPEKRKKDIFLSEELPRFKPDKIYVDITKITQNNADVEIFVTNDKWNNTLPQSAVIDKNKMLYPADIHMTQIKPGGQYISVRPYENGSFCIFLKDKGNWRKWIRTGRDKRSQYALEILYKADKNNFASITQDIKIAKFERSYNGASQTTISPVRKGYAMGYSKQSTRTANKLTCCVVNNVWSLFV